MKRKKEETKKPNFKGLQSVEDCVSKVLKPIFNGQKKEFTIINNLTKNWEIIIGKKYHKFCRPKAVSFGKKNAKGKLTISVFNPAIGFFLENNSELILERISSLYGFKSLEKIIIKQEPQEVKIKKEQEIKLSEKKEKNLKKIISKIENKDLAQTLEKLGRNIIK